MAQDVPFVVGSCLVEIYIYIYIYIPPLLLENIIPVPVPFSPLSFISRFRNSPTPEMRLQRVPKLVPFLVSFLADFVKGLSKAS